MLGRSLVLVVSGATVLLGISVLFYFGYAANNEPEPALFGLYFIALLAALTCALGLLKIARAAVVDSTASRKITFFLVASSLLLIALFLSRFKIEDKISCLAYYEQCTAKRIEGLSSAECFEREDVVAYLITQEVCLVKQPD